jgi:hypothetical protein
MQSPNQFPKKYSYICTQFGNIFFQNRLFLGLKAAIYEVKILVRNIRIKSPKLIAIRIKKI